MDEELDITKLKYVLYARKSTTDETRQVRSIPDQMRECIDLANRLGITVDKKYLKETKSAKTPNQRQIFTQMLEDIKAGKYQGILAWNPDRLARNMKEGGELIDMIDQGQLLDLKFVTHHFTNDANGKMLLGMAFVLSKQYSDDLSQKVTRGVRGRFKEGKTQVPKHGYINTDGIYSPDKRTFDVIRKAWEARFQGTSLKKIAKQLDIDGYYRKTKTGRKITINTKRLSDMFKDPFYYGVLVQANQQVDLRELYDFQPMITESEYNQVQTLSIQRLTPYTTNRRSTFYPFKTMVICKYCGGYMYAGASSGNTNKYLYYRCGHEGCKRKKKSIRGKVILDFIYNFFSKDFKLSKSDYIKYRDKFTKLADERRVKLRVQKNQKLGQIKAVKQEIKDRALNIGAIKTSDTTRQINENRIQELTEIQDQLEKDIKKIKKLITKPDDDMLSLQQFLNLAKNADEIVKKADAVQKDAICRLVFLNFTVDEEKVLSYRLKEPFKTMLKTRVVSSGRVKATDIELYRTLVDHLVTRWDHESVGKIIMLDGMINPTNHRQGVKYEY